MLLVNFTLFIISLLILLQCFSFIRLNLIEGASGSCDLDNDPVYLAKTNAADIKVMKEQVGDIKRMRDDMEILKDLVAKNTDGVKKMSDELQNQTSQLTGGFDGDIDSIPTMEGIE
jgi:hypothetical protein